MARSQAGAPGAGSGGPARGWGSAIVRAVVLILAVFVAFALIPNWLLDRLDTRATPTGRDLIIVMWWLVALGGCSWLFVLLQGRDG